MSSWRKHRRLTRPSPPRCRPTSCRFPRPRRKHSTHWRRATEGSCPTPRVPTWRALRPRPSDTARIMRCGWPSAAPAWNSSAPACPRITAWTRPPPAVPRSARRQVDGSVESRRRRDSSIGFLFAGQGSQHVGMGRALFKVSAEFRRLLQRCERLLRSHLDRPLLDVMFDDAGDGASLLRTEYAQPALFALEYSLAELLRTWGITPRFVIGHSLGEYVAACVAGVFTLEEGIVLTAARGRLMQALPGRGGMRAVAAGPDAIEPLLRPFAPDVSIAAINSPTPDRAFRRPRGARSTGGRPVVARDPFAPAVGLACVPFGADGPGLAALGGAVRPATSHPPHLRLISNLTGNAVTHEVTDPGYWCAQAREPVLFGAGIETLIQEGCETLVEIGPDGLLSHSIADHHPSRRIDTIATLQRGAHDWDAMLETLARLYVGGARVDWTAFQAGPTARPVRLPTYPFQRSRHWYQGPLVTAATDASSSPAAGRHPLLGQRLRLPGSAEIRFEARFSQLSPQFLADHRLFGVSLPPAASHLSMLAQAATVLAGSEAERTARFRFEALHLLRPLLLPDGLERDVQLICRPGSPGWSVELTSAEARDDGPPAGEWTTHMIGRGMRGRGTERRGNALGPGGDPGQLRTPGERCRVLCQRVGESGWHRIELQVDRIDLAGRPSGVVPRRLPRRDRRSIRVSPASGPDRSRPVRCSIVAATSRPLRGSKPPASPTYRFPSMPSSCTMSRRATVRCGVTRVSTN